MKAGRFIQGRCSGSREVRLIRGILAANPSCNRSRLICEIRGGESFLASENTASHFWLVKVTSVATLTLHWPSGRTEVYSDVAANQTVTIKEGVGIVL